VDPVVITEGILRPEAQALLPERLQYKRLAEVRVLIVYMVGVVPVG
jgi:hypothetical protein